MYPPTDDWKFCTEPGPFVRCRSKGTGDTPAASRCAQSLSRLSRRRQRSTLRSTRTVPSSWTLSLRTSPPACLRASAQTGGSGRRDTTGVEAERRGRGVTARGSHATAGTFGAVRSRRIMTGAGGLCPARTWEGRGPPEAGTLQVRWEGRRLGACRCDDLGVVSGRVG